MRTNIFIITALAIIGAACNNENDTPAANDNSIDKEFISFIMTAESSIAYQLDETVLYERESESDDWHKSENVWIPMFGDGVFNDGTYRPERLIICQGEVYSTDYAQRQRNITSTSRNLLVYCQDAYEASTGLAPIFYFKDAHFDFRNCTIITGHTIPGADYTTSKDRCYLKSLNNKKVRIEGYREFISADYYEGWYYKASYKSLGETKTEDGIYENEMRFFDKNESACIRNFIKVLKEHFGDEINFKELIDRSVPLLTIPDGINPEENLYDVIKMDVIEEHLAEYISTVEQFESYRPWN